MTISLLYNGRNTNSFKRNRIFSEVKREEEINNYKGRTSSHQKSELNTMSLHCI